MENIKLNCQIMKRKQLHQNNHPFDAHSFEAFWCDSWHAVECLNVSGGAIITRIVDDGDVVEVNIPMSHHRIKSRKATWADCLSLLRPGVDICVLSTPHSLEDTDDDRDAEPVWLDAKIRSIKRKPHDELCACQFYVSFYIEQGPGLLLANKKLSKETSLVKIDQISVLQKLEQKPCDTDYYRWSFSEDCCSRQKFKLFTGRFLVDLSWFLTASVLKRTAFNVRSVRNHIVYEISENKCNEGEVDPQIILMP